MDSRRLSAQAKIRCVAVHAAIEAEPGLHAEADSHDLAMILGRGLAADVAGHDVSAVTRCHHMKAASFAYSVGAGFALSVVAECHGILPGFDSDVGQNLCVVAHCDSMASDVVAVAAAVAVAATVGLDILFDVLYQKLSHSIMVVAVVVVGVLAG